MRPLEVLYAVPTADGRVLALTQLGDRRAKQGFLLVHGLGQNRTSYTKGPLPGLLLARGAAVYLAELRGHGRSRETSLDHGLADHLERDLPALLDFVLAHGEARRVHYVGHSLGGMLGYALAARRAEDLASITTFAAPLPIARGRPQIRAAGAIARVLLPRVPIEAVPMRWLLRQVAGVATLPHEGWLGRLGDLVRLGTPHHRERETLRAVLHDGADEPRRLFVELLRLMDDPPLLAGVDLVAAARAFSGPLVAVLGSRDVFGSVETLTGFSSGQGPRRTRVVADAGHVDVTMGRYLEAWFPEWWDFLMRG